MDPGTMSTENTVTSQPAIDGITTPKSYYNWTPEGKPVQVWLDFDVIDRMSAEVMRGFGSVPKRGAEVGGVLLGEVDRTTGKLSIHVHDFVMVPCDYRRGPSYQLTDSDTQLFSEAVAKAAQGTTQDLRPLGYFRSHTRDGMGLTEDDLQLFSNYFPDPSSVILLVRPFATKVSQAGFFFEENGQIRSDATYLTFPFRRRELGGGSIGENPRQGAEAATEALERAAGALPLAEAATAGGQRPAGATEAFAQAGNSIDNRRLFGNVEETPPGISGFDSSAFQRDSLGAMSNSVPYSGQNPVGNEASQKIKKSWVWLPLSSIFLMLGVVVGFLIAITMRQPNTGVPLSAYGLSLAVQQESDSVHVTWDRGAVPVAIATRGILHIQDGDFYKAVELKAADLQTGSVIIRNVGSNVTLRLEVFFLDRNSLSEVRVVKNVNAPLK